MFRGSGTYHEITLDELQLIRQTLLLRISCRTLDLVIIVVQSGNVCTSEFCDFSGRATNSAANVEDFVSVFDANLAGQVMFVTRNGLVKGFAVCEAAEMEGLAPAVFVEVGAQVVVTITIRSVPDIEETWREERKNILSCEGSIFSSS